MENGKEPVNCPFCGYSPPRQDQEEYAMLMHIETDHPEGKSPFVPDEQLSDLKTAVDQPDGASDAYVECPIEGCNEVVVQDELDYHLELHSEEAEEDSPGPFRDSAMGVPADVRSDESLQRPNKRRRSSPNRDTSVDSEDKASTSHRIHVINAWRNIFSMPKRRLDKAEISGTTISTSSDDPAPGTNIPKKLGKAELGRYAHEQRMPSWLVAMLQKGGQVVGKGIIPVLQQLLEQSEETAYAYLCHPCVQHVSKLRREGGFCGYRNIQMLSSYVIGVGHEGSQHFGDQLPSIFDIQEYIESAWDQGINKQGRVETGGVRGTRKYIGTPEAQAMFIYLNITCEAQGFKNKKVPGAAEASLLDSVELYFQQGLLDPNEKVHCTSLPPIYFQHAGHSMTIVGVEKEVTGKVNLLVFDPMFRDASVITQRVGKQFKYKQADHALNAYRRGRKYLKRYREFEILRLKSLPDIVLEG